MMPACYNKKSPAEKETWLAGHPATGLLTGVVSTAGGAFLGGLDLHDINFVYNLRLGGERPLVVRRTPCNDNGERRVCQVQIRRAVDGQVEGGNMGIELISALPGPSRRSWRRTST